ncbi:hypothetical protein K435DRAFT_654934 [Dendrothele bispora CBS 962.96]|uniref:Uncharacterized protein n=1 Tax=Dendrothele bispora (strain CBS 962.96) TaxID=1314807 RepID=A0A4S8MG25_DENBC|nr:hypothetical protein K435DRAFT_654934 [Dendrothele bispora CBS 962.96]
MFSLCALTRLTWYFQLEHVLNSTHDEAGETASFESALIRGADGFLHPFGLPRDKNAATNHEFVRLSRQKDTLRTLEARLANLSEDSCSAQVIQSTLSELEDGTRSLLESLVGVRRSNVTDPLVQELETGLRLLDARLVDWRVRHPDTTPIRIDNSELYFRSRYTSSHVWPGKYFSNPNSRRQTPTLIAYCIALVGRVFEGASERGATFLLKMLKVFGHSLTMLGRGGDTLEQSNAISDIPDSISTLEKRMNLGISTVPYAVCPSCSCTYKPTYPVGSSQPVYDRTCTNRTYDGVCSSEMLDDLDRPLKIFHYYPFFDWFGKFISLPGIEQYGDKFCEHVSAHPENPPDKCDARDGSFVRTFRANDGGLFVADRGDEGRWFFRFHGDFFNVEGNRIQGATKSTGLLGLLCLNLPLNMTNDPAYIYIPGLIQGPDEPASKEAAHTYYLLPLFQDLDLAYTRGVTPFHSHQTYNQGKPWPYNRTHRIALAKAVMDLKAARPFAGLLDVSSHHFCFLCSCWHTSQLMRTDFEKWGIINDDSLRKGAALWLNAETEKERVRIEAVYGTRHSAMWTLKYWRPSEQLVPEPMHTFFLRVLQNFFRVALGLENPDKRKSRPHFRAFYHDFTPPPLPSDTSASGPKPQNPSTQILDDRIAFRDVYRIHQALSASSPSTNSDRNDYSKKLMNMKWVALLYVCNDLMLFPANRSALKWQLTVMVGQIQKREMVDVLVNWRRGKPTQELKWVYVDSSAVLERLHQAISEVTTPAWVGKPPPNVGLPNAGTLKADHWRTLFSIHLPLTLLSMWGKGSPLATPDAGEMSSVLETALWLSCALIIMTKDTLTTERRESFRFAYRQHILGLRKNFPGFFKPTHHLAFHIYEFMDRYGPLRNWWAFFFERLIGRLQRQPTNHQTGQLERTLLYGFNSGASFQQWLLRPDCPPLLKYCLNLLDKTYSYVNRGYTTGDRDDSLDQADEEQDNENISNLLKGHELPDISKWVLSTPPSSELLSMCGCHDLEKIRCFSRITAPRGFYTIPSSKAIGNSYLCFKDGDSWSAGQIQHIFDLGDGVIRMAIKRCVPLNLRARTDPFSTFFPRGFEAKMVSSAFKNKLEIIKQDEILGHIARWELRGEKLLY